MGPEDIEIADPAVMAPAVPGAVALREPGWRTAGVVARWRAASLNLRCSLILLVALVAFTGMTIGIKVAGQTIPLLEILFIRQFIMQILMVPMYYGDFPAVLRTPDPLIHIGRGLLQLGAMVFSFVAVVHLPLSLAMTISFSYAILVTIGAAIFIKERVDLGRWIASAVGIAGVAVMLQPSLESSALYVGAAVLGAVFSAGSAVSLRLGPTGQRTDTILTYQALVLLAALAVPTWLAWVTPSLTDWLLLIGIGVTGTIGQYMLTVAYQRGDAAALAPLDFVRLLLTTVCGLVIFDDIIDGWMVAGAVLLLGATAYTFWANAQHARLRAAGR